MNIYRASDLVHCSEDDIWCLEEGPIQLYFDDGVTLNTTGKETIISSYAWDIHRRYPATPIMSRHHIGTKRFNASTYLDLLSYAIWDCKDVYANEIDDMDNELRIAADAAIARVCAKFGFDPVDMDDMARAAYEITNQTYNSLSERLEEYPSSLDAIDWVEALDHPPIAEYREKMYACRGIGLYNPDDFNELVKRELMHAPELTGNGVANLIRGARVTDNQIGQCVGSRGRATDITSDVFPDPILGGFATGMDSILDMAKESRSASLSLYFQKDPMKKSEYFNRNIQLSSATLSTLYYEDCGSRQYINITINSTKVLRDMSGIAYYDETLGKERLIRKNMRDLVGRTIPIRSVLTCQHPDRNGICVRCFGELGFSIPQHTNIGHVSSSEMQSKVGQLLLSNKHYLASAIIAALQISEHDAIFIQPGPAQNHLYTTELFVGHPYKIRINNKEALNLGDVHAIVNTDTLTPSRVSSLTELTFLYDVDGFERAARVDCQIGTRNASLSREFLRYVKRVGWRTTDDGDYIVDMTEWKREEPLLELPLKHFSTLDYMLGIEKFIKGGEAKEKGNTMVNQESHEKALSLFHDLVGMKLDVNFSYLQTIYLAALVQDRRGRDYRLPMPRYEGQSARYRQLMLHRSIAAMMAFQEQKDALYSVESYLIKVRPEHPFDQLVFG